MKVIFKKRHKKSYETASKAWEAIAKQTGLKQSDVTSAHTEKIWQWKVKPSAVSKLDGLPKPVKNYGWPVLGFLAAIGLGAWGFKSWKERPIIVINGVDHLLRTVSYEMSAGKGSSSGTIRPGESGTGGAGSGYLLKQLHTGSKAIFSGRPR